MRAALAALAAASALLAPAAADAQEVAGTVRSGQLEVRVLADPFGIEAIDRSDGDVLRTLAGALPDPADPNARYGPLGYSFDLREPVVNNAFLGYYKAAEVSTVWFHARRTVASARDGEALVVEAQTNDPLGHRLRVRIAPAGEGAVTVDSRIAPGSGPLAGRERASGAAFVAAPDERYLGFGERSNAVDQTGNLVFSWAEEGPFSSGDYEDFLRPRAPQFTFPTGPTTTNFPIPWLVSTRGLGVLVDQTERSNFHLLDERRDAWRVEAETARLRLALFAGPKPADVVRRYSDHAGGRQPDPAPWLFGPWVQFAEDWPERFRARDVPTTVGQTYTHYLPCGAHVGQDRRERDTVARYHRLGYKVTTYFNPHVCLEYSRVYDDAARRGLFVRNRAGQPYVLSNPFTADEQVSEIDFTHPEGVALFQRLLDEALDHGYDGWMEDFGEYTPTDSVFSDGRGGLEMHNLYPVLYHRASTEHTRRRRGRDLAVFVRSGYHGSQPYARVVWGGDPTEDWSCADGLCAAVHQALSTGLSGIAYQGSDIGGFHAIANGRTGDELNIRWLEVGAVSGVMRTQANGFSFRSDRASRSQVWSPAVLPTWRRYAKLRTQLLPYLEAASEEYQRTAMPIARHLSLVFPDDPRAVRRQTEFMFGPDLLAAPVVEEGARSRSLYLPEGEWVDLWRSARFDEESGDLRLRPARVLTGGRDVTLPAPLEELPLLVRAGAVLPLLPHTVDTLANLGGGKDLVRLDERRHRMHLVAFPRGRSTARLGGRARIESAERSGGRWQLRVRATRRRSYWLQAALSTLHRPLRPCRVRLGRKRLARRLWTYDAGRQVLRVKFRTRSGALVVESRCRARRR